MSYDIVLSSRKAIDFEPTTHGTLVWNYKLAKSYSLDGEYMIKLLGCHGSRTPYMFMSDIVTLSDSFGSEEPVLGSSMKHTNTYRKVNGFFIPSHGTITVKSISGAPIHKVDHIVLFLHLVRTDLVATLAQ